MVHISKKAMDAAEQRSKPGRKVEDETLADLPNPFGDDTELLAGTRRKGKRKRKGKNPEEAEVRKRRLSREERMAKKKERHAAMRKFKHPPVVVTRRRELPTEGIVARSQVERIDRALNLAVSKHELHYIEKLMSMLKHEQTGVWRSLDAVLAARHSKAIDNVIAILKALHKDMDERRQRREEGDEPDPQGKWLRTRFSTLSDHEMEEIRKEHGKELLEGMGIQIAALDSQLLMPDWIIDIDRAELLRVSGKKERVENE